MTIRVIDWFSGIGGFRLGLEMAGGFEIVAHSEIDDYAEKVYQRHWPGSRNLGDVREITDVPEADLWCGGFPCQPFSVAGARRGAADDRNLWPVWFDLIRAHRPRYILGENVPGLLADRQFGRILADLSSAGYVSEWTVIGARDVGAPHRRDRLWIWAYLGDTERAPKDVHAEGRRPRDPVSESGAADVEDPARAELRARSGRRGVRQAGEAPDLAHGDERGREVERVEEHGEQQGARGDYPDGCSSGRWRSGQVADTDEPGSQGRDGGILQERSGECAIGPGGAWSEGPEQRGAVAYTGSGPELRGQDHEVPAGRYAAGGSDSWPPGWTLDPADVGDSQIRDRAECSVLVRQGKGQPRGTSRSSGGGCPCCGADQGPTPPLLGRVAHGVPSRVDRLRCLGNAVVPQVVAWIGERIREGIA